MKVTIYILTAFLLITGCKKEDQHLPPDFNYPIPQVDITENVNVGAFYYAHTASNWGPTSDTSTLGEYSSLDLDVMNQERQWADQGGVDFLIFNWNGSADDALLEAFINGRSSNVKMVINYNTSHLKATNASPLTGDKLNTMINEFKTLATTYFNNDYYYKINGQPVVLITPVNLSSNALSSIDYTTVMPALKDAISGVGVNLYTIGQITSGWLPPQRYNTAIQTMDAVTLSDWSTNVYDRAVMIAPFMDMNWKNWTDSTTTWGVDYVPCIFPGYNDKATSPKSKNYNIDRSAELYTDFCNVAKRNMSDKRIVLINSWNNFQLATEIEPSKEYGDTYLDITKSQFKIK